MKKEVETKTSTQFSTFEKNQKNDSDPSINNFFFNPNYKKNQKYSHMRRIHEQAIYSMKIMKKTSFDCFPDSQNIKLDQSIIIFNINIIYFFEKKNKKQSSSIWMRL